MHSILIIDDEDYVLKSLGRLLRSKDYAISCYHDPHEALAQCSVCDYDLILSDQRMPGMLGTEFFQEIAQRYPATRRILISGYSDFSNVTEAFNDGIIHKFVVKPWQNAQLRQLVVDQLALHDSGEDSQHGASGMTAETAAERAVTAGSFHGLRSDDEGMLQQIDVIRRSASSDAPFFIHGETGTGKELVARSIHLESTRSEALFQALNCANLTESLLESQLFGHRKGAFTGADKDQTGLLAEAEGGSLFLDEVTEIPLPLQAKLLRVLQEREFTPLGETRPIPFDVKIISASSLSLERAVAAGRFREDLRYRLEVIPIELPPLRARGADKRKLFDYFLHGQFQRHQRQQPDVSDAVYQCIANYGWPGNVRELVNVCTYIAALAGEQARPIEVVDLPPALRQGPAPTDEVEDRAESVTKSSQAGSRHITREGLEQALKEFAGHRESVARHFGVSRMTLWRKMKQFDLV